MKTPGERLVLARDPQRRLEARDLPAERVPLDDEVDQAEPLAVEHDHPGAGAEDRRRKGSDRLVEAVEAHQSQHRRRLPARDHEAVEALRAAPAAVPRPPRPRAGEASPRARGTPPGGPGRRLHGSCRLGEPCAAPTSRGLRGARRRRARRTRCRPSAHRGPSRPRPGSSRPGSGSSPRRSPSRAGRDRPT